ncbi:hypothetical protein THTE_0766 [Thermogutta terrifontis]|uniref:Uncharacterized protein n=1 Tax=Thermogutta terrifontis TaxID=1331910 RepID=A0A286RBM7_9BACT|nr:hypothetical protein THTE_0766 [Thermogutta terrifontis]
MGLPLLVLPPEPRARCRTAGLGIVPPEMLIGWLQCSART